VAWNRYSHQAQGPAIHELELTWGTVVSSAVYQTLHSNPGYIVEVSYGMDGDVFGLIVASVLHVRYSTDWS